MNAVAYDSRYEVRIASTFLSVRKLLQEASYNDFDLSYDELGKPHLKDGKHFITHSYQFSAIIISDQTVGIDIELQREK
jgi:phosphopantetheinyl transferase